MISLEDYAKAFGLTIDDGSRQFDTREEAEAYLDEDDPRDYSYNWATNKYEVDSWDEFCSTHEYNRITGEWE